MFQTITMSKKAAPTLHLRGIDYRALADRIEKGDYTVSNVYTPVRLKLTSKKMEQEVIVGKTDRDPIYEQVEGDVRKKIYTTNVTLYNEALRQLTVTVPQSSEGTVTKRPTRCVYCRRLIGENPYVLSIITAIERVGGGSKDVPSKTAAVKTLFHGYDPACNENCAYTHLQREKQMNPRNSFYAQAEINLNYYIFLATGTNRPPVMLPDWRLLEDNDGSMSATEFFAGTRQYRRLDSVVMVPAKLQYE